METGRVERLKEKERVQEKEEQRQVLAVSFLNIKVFGMLRDRGG